MDIMTHTTFAQPNAFARFSTERVVHSYVKSVRIVDALPTQWGDGS